MKVTFLSFGSSTMSRLTNSRTPTPSRSPFFLTEFWNMSKTVVISLAKELFSFPTDWAFQRMPSRQTPELTRRLSPFSSSSGEIGNVLIRQKSED